MRFQRRSHTSYATDITRSSSYVGYGNDTVYMVEELDDKIGISYTKQRGFVKGVHAWSLPFEGVARGTQSQIDRCRRKADITFASFDDEKFYLGTDFLNMVKGILVVLHEPYVHHVDMLATEYRTRPEEHVPSHIQIYGICRYGKRNLDGKN